jgi:hypothetical protein
MEATRGLCAIGKVRTYPARGPAAGGLREESLQLGDELVDLLVGDPATAARHLSPRLGSGWR